LFSSDSSLAPAFLCTASLSSTARATLHSHSQQLRSQDREDERAPLVGSLLARPTCPDAITSVVMNGCSARLPNEMMAPLQQQQNELIG
jgi:hypothetical protein